MVGTAPSLIQIVGFRTFGAVLAIAAFESIPRCAACPDQRGWHISSRGVGARRAPSDGTGRPRFRKDRGHNPETRTPSVGPAPYKSACVPLEVLSARTLSFAANAVSRDPEIHPLHDRLSGQLEWFGQSCSKFEA